MVNALVLYC